MFMAQLRGKMPSEDWLSSEDLLTSAVLGTLKNLSPWITVHLLTRARPLEGHAHPSLAAPLAWHFWPWWDTCEPDVVLEDACNLCVLEAKLYSEFGEDVGADRQLRREWADGQERANSEGKAFWLVALTNHATVPEEIMRAQLRGSPADLTHVCWLSWLEIGLLLREVDDDAARGWCEDLLELLQRMGLAPCDGFAEVVALAQDLPPHAMPWTNRLQLQGHSVAHVGFAEVSAYARSLGGFGRTAWRPAMGSERR